MPVYAELSSEQQAQYTQGVGLYQQGHYQAALQCFQSITQHSQADANSWYYLAITQAQLNQFAVAREAYLKTIAMAPDSDAARLAQEGLNYLPKAGGLDTPPQFNPSSATSAQTANTASSPFGNMDPKALQMMMLMSSMGGGGKGGFNPMMMPLMQSMMKGSNPQSGSENSQDDFSIPPEAMSTMMMNQMMQDFNPFNSKDD